MFGSLRKLLGTATGNIVHNVQGAERQLNPFDGGKTFGTQPPEAPTFAPLPTIDTKQPLPHVNQLGVPTDNSLGTNGAIFSNSTGSFFDPYGSNRQQTQYNGSYLRVPVDFPEHQDIPDMQYANGPEDIRRILGRY